MASRVLFATNEPLEPPSVRSVGGYLEQRNKYALDNWLERCVKVAKGYVFPDFRDADLRARGDELARRMDEARAALNGARV